MNDLLIVRFLSGKVSEKESQEILKWLNADHKNRMLYFHIKRIWQEDAVKEMDTENLNYSWERLKLRIDKPVKELTSSREKHVTLWSFKRIAVAAGILILAGSTLFFSLQSYQNARHGKTLNHICVPMGSMSNITLPDGSTVWLNAGSKLTYSADFGRKERVVILEEGEGFFDVTYNNNVPFLVNVGELKIRVLGTKFNVKSYPEEKVIETTLVQGMVEVNSVIGEIKGRSVILEPNQKLTYIRKGGSMEIASVEKKKKKVTSQTETQKTTPFRITRNVNPDVSTSWKDGKLIFEGEPLACLAPKLERFYNVKISFQDESMKKLKFTGTLEEVTIEEVLKAIERTSPICYEINKNQVLLKKSNLDFKIKN